MELWKYLVYLNVKELLQRKPELVEYCPKLIRVNNLIIIIIIIIIKFFLIRSDQQKLIQNK